MNVETIQMDPRIAGVHYRDYLKQCQEEREERRKKLAAEAKAAGRELGRIRIEKTRIEKEHEELLKAYRALKRGQRLINVAKAIRTVGFNDEYMPKLAIANASFEKIRLSVNQHSSEAKFESTRYQQNLKSRVFEMPRGDFPAELLDGDWRGKNGLTPVYMYRALVPIIPPHVRPKDLTKYFVLWEANWEKKAPDPDPFLLSRINETMFAIVAQWDLTPIELSILEGRA